MIGYMKFSGMYEKQEEQVEESDSEKHRFDIIGDDDGFIAIIPFPELKKLYRRAPKEMCIISQVACNHALDTISLNISGDLYNNTIKHDRQTIPMKKIRKMMQNERIRGFVKGMDKRDEKIFLLNVKPVEMVTTQRIIRKNTFERCFFIVGSGEVTVFGENYNKTIKEGGVVGEHEFLTGASWAGDVLCSK